MHRDGKEELHIDDQQIMELQHSTNHLQTNASAIKEKEMLNHLYSRGN